MSEKFAFFVGIPGFHTHQELDWIGETLQDFGEAQSENEAQGDAKR